MLIEQTTNLYTCIGAGCGLTSIVLGKLCGCGVLAVDKSSVMQLLTDNIQSNCVVTATNENEIVKTRCFDWITAVDASQESIRQALQWSECASSSHHTTNYHFPTMIVLSDCFYQFDAVEPILKILDVMAGDSTFVLVANELRTAFDEFLNKLRNQEREWKFEVSEPILGCLLDCCCLIKLCSMSILFVGNFTYRK